MLNCFQVICGMMLLSAAVSAASVTLCSVGCALVCDGAENTTITLCSNGNNTVYQSAQCLPLAGSYAGDDFKSAMFTVTGGGNAPLFFLYQYWNSTTCDGTVVGTGSQDSAPKHSSAFCKSMFVNIGGKEYSALAAVSGASAPSCITTTQPPAASTLPPNTTTVSGQTSTAPAVSTTYAGTTAAPSHGTPPWVWVIVAFIPILIGLGIYGFIRYRRWSNDRAYLSI